MTSAVANAGLEMTVAASAADADSAQPCGRILRREQQVRALGWRRTAERDSPKTTCT